MIESMEAIQNNLHQISLPLLVVHGAGDPIVQFTSSEFVFKEVASVDKTFLVCCMLQSALHV